MLALLDYVNLLFSSFKKFGKLFILEIVNIKKKIIVFKNYNIILIYILHLIKIKFNDIE